MTIKKATLVLEGGATRGIFTSGALDYLMERDLYFSDVIGVRRARAMRWTMFRGSREERETV